MTDVAEKIPASSETEKAETPPTKAAITLTHLKRALRIVGAAIERKSTIPVLQSVRIEQLSEGLAIEATNLDIYIRALVAESGGPANPLLIPAEKFMAWTNLLSGNDVKLSATNRSITVQCGRSRAVLPVMSAASWPNNSCYELKGDGITLRQDALARALRFTLMAVSNEESRYTINAVLLEGDGKTLKMVATDGHRMAIYTLPLDDKISLLMPSRMLKTVMPLLVKDGGVDINYTDKMILVSIAEEMPVFIASPKITGTFPNYTAVVPTGKRTEVTVKSGEFLDALVRCDQFSDERSGLVILNFEKQITITSASAANGESEETVDCVGQPDQPVRIGVRAEYLIDIAKRLDGEIRIALPNDGQSCLLFKAAPQEGETLDYIVMPMRM